MLKPMHNFSFEKRGGNLTCMKSEHLNLDENARKLKNMQKYNQPHFWFFDTSITESNLEVFCYALQVFMNMVA